MNAFLAVIAILGVSASGPLMAGANAPALAIGFWRNALGTIAVGLLLGAGVQDGPWEWRTFYLVGLVPLLALNWFRRRLKETRLFEALVSTKPSPV